MKKFFTYIGASLLSLYVVCGVFFVGAHEARSAEIFFGIHGKEIGVGQTFEVGVFLDTERTTVNAVEGTVVFPEASLKLVDIKRGNSLINLWIKTPATSQGAAGAGTISFSGIVPGGYVGDDGYLFSIIFSAEKVGSIEVKSDNERILLHDGKGSPTTITHAPLALAITEKSNGNEFVPASDTVPPEPFTPEVAHDQNLFDGNYFLVFGAQDKDSGVDHYEIKEGFWNSFKKAESPYLLRNQALDSTITVRAVDTAGNVREAVVPPTHLAWYQKYLLSGIVVIIAIITALWFFSVQKKYGKNR